MSSRLFIDLVLHINMQISHRGDPSLPLKNYQKVGKISTRFQHYMYFMHLVILHYCSVTWLNILLWIYGRIWTFFKFLQHGEYPAQVTLVIGISYNSGPNTIHRGTITSFDAYHEVKKWFLHHMNGLVLFRRYTWSLDTLELSVLIAFSFLFGRFASLAINRIGTWPYLTSPWVTRCPKCLFVSFLSLLSIFWRTSHSTLFHCSLNGLGCGLGLPNHWARVITERAAIFKKVMPMAMENLSIAQHQNTLWYAHTRW